MDIVYLPATDISPWLPFASSPYFLEDYFGNQVLYPSTLPQSDAYKYLDHAILRARLRYETRDVQPADIKSKEMTQLGNLVSINEQGITILPNMMHSIANVREAVHIVLDGLEPSSTPLFLHDSGSDRFICYAVCIEGDDWLSLAKDQSLQIQFASGNSVDLPLIADSFMWCSAPSQEAVLEFSLNKASIGGKHKGTIPIVFGEYGIVIDTRGRPFPLPQDNETGRARVKQWLAAMEQVRFL